MLYLNVLTGKSFQIIKEDPKTIKSVKTSLIVSIIVLIFPGLIPTWQYLLSNEDIGLTLITFSFFLFPIVTLLSFLGAYIVHKYFLIIEFKKTYSLIFSILAGLLTFLQMLVI